MKNKNKFLDIIKIITLILLSILILVIIINKILVENKKDNTNTYLSWCRSDYLEIGSLHPSSVEDWMVDCVNSYKAIERKVK